MHLSFIADCCYRYQFICLNHPSMHSKQIRQPKRLVSKKSYDVEHFLNEKIDMVTLCKSLCPNELFVSFPSHHAGSTLQSGFSYKVFDCTIPLQVIQEIQTQFNSINRICKLRIDQNTKQFHHHCNYH